MGVYIKINTPHLILRPFNPSDAPQVQKLAGDFAIADTTLRIPHPYENGMAEAWIQSHAKNEDEITLAVLTGSDQELIGAISLNMNKEHANAEMGYWIGKPLWNQGYASEAAAAMLRFGFKELGLHRIYARHFSRNAASGRVLQKIGMNYEGSLREHIKKWDKFEDVKIYGILYKEYED